MATPGSKNLHFSAQVTSVVLGRQLGRVDSAYMKYRATLQEIKAKIECCEAEDCWGIPAKVKTTVCPTGVEQVTQLEFTPDGSHIIFGTSKNKLYIMDLRKLKNLSSETVATNAKEVAANEHFKIIRQYARRNKYEK